MARGSKGGSTGSLDVVRAVTAVPHRQRWKKVAVGFNVVARGYYRLFEGSRYLISVSRRTERARVLHIKGA
jgi:hypothetical protein